MALAERVTKRFRGVPGVTSTDITNWITEAEEESGFTADDTDTATNRDNALLYLAFAIGCETIALEAARYFKYTDGDESIDKTGIADEYRKHAAYGRKMFGRFRSGNTSGGAVMTAPARFDGR